MLSLRTTGEIYANPYGLPWPPHLDKYVEVWTKFNYAIFFRNSIVVTTASMALGTAAAAMAAFVLGRRRYDFPYREWVFLAIFISIMFPPQITLISLFQQLVNYGLYNSLPGLILVYAASELPLQLSLFLHCVQCYLCLNTLHD